MSAINKTVFVCTSSEESNHINEGKWSSFFPWMSRPEALPISLFSHDYVHVWKSFICCCSRLPWPKRRQNHQSRFNITKEGSAKPFLWGMSLQISFRKILKQDWLAWFSSSVIRKNAMCFSSISNDFLSSKLRLSGFKYPIRMFGGKNNFTFEAV